MFKSEIICLIFLLVALIMGSALFFYQPTESDYQRYQQLMVYSDSPGKNLPKEKNISTHQKRLHVTKQMIFLKDQERLQTRLKSVSSELIFGQQANSVELVEYFKELSCLMQEKLIRCQHEDEESLINGQAFNLETNLVCQNSSSNQQLIRSFQAPQAVYHYKTEELTAEEVKIARYLIPGYEWRESLAGFKPMMTGQAQSIRLSFSNQKSFFKAQGFHASFQEWEKAL